jgi:hypothetical protein
MNFLSKLLPFTAALLLASAAHAQILVYTTTLSGAIEVPPNLSPATGTATVTVNLGANTLRLETSFSGLLGNTTAAHIHGPTPAAGTGTAGVMTTTPSFVGFPLGVTAISPGFMDQTYDLGLSGTYGSTFLNTTHSGSIASARAAYLTALADGKAYLNIHTTSFAGGEIRGFFTAVPEPSTYAAVIGAAALGVVALRRRRS